MSNTSNIEQLTNLVNSLQNQNDQINSGNIAGTNIMSISQKLDNLNNVTIPSLNDNINNIQSSQDNLQQSHTNFQNRLNNHKNNAFVAPVWGNSLETGHRRPLDRPW